MPILPNTSNPLKQYVTAGSPPPLTVDGLVYSSIYANTGVVDSLTNTNTTGYTDPNFNTLSQSNASTTFDKYQTGQWFSSTDFGGPNSAPIVITYSLVNTTYYNLISFAALNVPCFIELLDQNLNALPGSSTFIVPGGSDIFTTTDWLNLQYSAPSTLTGVTSINLRITRNKTVQVNNPIYGLADVAYSVGLKGFRIKLNVQSITDIPSAVVSGTTSIVTQNKWGLVESYSYQKNAVSNIFSNNSSYWKSGPQPVADAVVFFYAQVSDPNTTAINRLYIDPIYSGCKFNIYYTTASTSGNTIDPGNFTWTPINRDFTLRKGIYDIPTINCTYLKFEFTQLIPEVYDLPFDSIQRTINVFPLDVENFYQSLENSIIDANSVKYSTLTSKMANQTGNNGLNISTRFGVSSSTMANKNTWPSIGALNQSQLGAAVTQGLNSSSQIIDPSKSYKLLDQNGNYNGSTYTQFLQRRFPYAEQHSYNQININQTWHQAYFTGIRYLTFFFENTYDDLRGTPYNLFAKNGTNSGFSTQDVNYVGLNLDDTATTPWFSTIDSFKSFNIGGLTTDWRSFLTQGNPISLDNTLMNNLNSAQLASMQIYSTLTKYGSLGKSTVYTVSGISGTQYGLKSAPYQYGNNIMNYYDANFIPVSGSLNWKPVGSTNVTSTAVAWVSGTASGTVSGITVSGGSNAATYNFTIPTVYTPSGSTAWTVQLGSQAYGTVGYASYAPGSGVNYYFLATLQSSGITNVSMYTQFINATTSGVIPGTTVSGGLVQLNNTVSGLVTITGTNYTVSGLPSNTIQVVLSGSANNVPYQVYEAGVFQSPTSTWVTPSDRTKMRVSGAVRVFLPGTNKGTYRASLYGVDTYGNTTEIAYKTYGSFNMPLNTWFDIELQSYTTYDYVSFYTPVSYTHLTLPTIYSV